MEKRFIGWWKQGFGKKLRTLHAWNGWIVLFLAISGILLYYAPIRTILGVVRVWLKQSHILAGLVSMMLVIMYLPMIRKHLRQLSKKRGQQVNLAFVLLLLAGWIFSGIILWQFQSFPPIWSNVAVIIHDSFTWIGVPYALYHSISRSRWIKAIKPVNGNSSTVIHPEKKAITEENHERNRVFSGPSNHHDKPHAVGVYQTAERKIISLFSRRSFLRVGLGTLLIAIVGPMFYRWLSSSIGGSTKKVASLPTPTTEGGMMPVPSPLPDSLPPLGGGAQGNFRIYTVTDMPVFTAKNWSFRIDGLVDHPKSWDWQSFLQMPRVVQVSDFHCVTGWSVYHCTWEGIPLSRMLEETGIQSKANVIKFYSGDGVYTDTLTLDQARMEDVMLVVLLDGKPIPQELGGPVRLIVPKMYAYKSVKWLHRIELIDHDHTGYWEERGYSNDAWVKG